ncbi:amidase signature domain-containing protein [Emericellopsis atlantica]|uniref:Amidase signature domain-containing protein n=1 Tax=Emericellopsis atlantica TaxID=2614577 RepID=A0A9P8CP80_9HYPO|nr:amidase signature domain-containing protein [Emericellopsis atlantica]KAG9252496.1 amidase signature domain-containing protein [Emericellopsis atlantica]
MAKALHTLCASEAQECILRGNFTVEAYTEALLDRVAARDSEVHAWATLDPLHVLEQARRLDRIPKDQRGPLHGFVIGVKDVINTEDFPTKHNSPLHQDDPTLIDATSVAILRANGALIMGKTRTTEYAVVAVTPGTKNPHDPSRSPGGSSSGSAAAVADYQVPIGLGTQTIGSIMRPSSFNGVYGFKPTWNSISSEGQKVTSPTLDTFGFMARDPRDLRKLSDVFGLKDDEAPRKGEMIAGQKFAILRPPMWKNAGPGTVAAMEMAGQILRDAGATVDEIALPSDFENVLKLQTDVLRHEIQVVFHRESTCVRDTMSKELVAATAGIEGTPRRTFLRSFDALAALRGKMDEIASDYAAIIAPSSVDVAPVTDTWTGDPQFNGMWTGLHTPAINVPGFAGEGDMPVGVTLVSGRYRDEHLLQVAASVGPLFSERGGWKSKLA